MTDGTTATRPFRIEVSDAALTDLRERLERTRWPEAETVRDWSQGVPRSYLEQVCDYWRSSYDWRRAERQLNAIPQFTTELDGIEIHFLHARSPHPGALPLIITHGWPGSVVEFLKAIGPLTDPPAHGGDAADAFDVVCPSLPGYGFSQKPAAPGWGTERIAVAWTELMARLGYARYGAQGGDWGAAVTMEMGAVASPGLVGIHVNMPIADPAALKQFGELTEQERAAVASFEHYRRFDSGYAREQGTRPQTIGYALVDSPAALAAWIIDKFWSWTDADGHPENVLTRDELLDNVMLYWLPAAGASAARLYWENYSRRRFPPIEIPSGCSIFPKEVFGSSRRWAATRFRDLRYWNELDRGGHFAAFEQPELFVDELRAFFRLVR
jgi:pimeloyl-ACP methyl ester carboxylesterase